METQEAYRTGRETRQKTRPRFSQHPEFQTDQKLMLVSAALFIAQIPTECQHAHVSAIMDADSTHPHAQAHEGTRMTMCTCGCSRARGAQSRAWGAFALGVQSRALSWGEQTKGRGGAGEGSERMKAHTHKPLNTFTRTSVHRDERHRDGDTARQTRGTDSFELERDGRRDSQIGGTDR